MKVIEIMPIGKHKAWAFVTRADGCGVDEIEVNEYPPSPAGEDARKLRVECGLRLHDVAKALGVGAAEVSGVERGSHVPENWAAWVFGIVKLGERREKGGGQ